MTPQIQTILSDTEKGIYGNCLITTYASYLDLLVDECPQFQLFYDVKHPYGFWDIIVQEWLQTQGYVRKFCFNDPFIENGFDDYYFSYGLSPRGLDHQVIYKEGKLFHDPHPSSGGIIPEGYLTLQKIEGHYKWKNS